MDARARCNLVATWLAVASALFLLTSIPAVQAAPSLVEAEEAVSPLEWTSMTPLPDNRVEHTHFVHGGFIYLLGETNKRQNSSGHTQGESESKREQSVNLGAECRYDMKTPHKDTERRQTKQKGARPSQPNDPRHDAMR